MSDPVCMSVSRPPRHTLLHPSPGAQCPGRGAGPAARSPRLCPRRPRSPLLLRPRSRSPPRHVTRAGDAQGKALAPGCLSVACRLGRRAGGAAPGLAARRPEHRQEPGKGPRRPPEGSLAVSGTGRRGEHGRVPCPAPGLVCGGPAASASAPRAPPALPGSRPRAGGCTQGLSSSLPGGDQKGSQPPRPNL